MRWTLATPHDPSMTMTESMSKIRADFDRIALLSGDDWSHNSHYHDFLLKQLPLHCMYALDIGCGTGAFSRLLARRTDRVLALDLSPQMIRIARERSEQYPNIDFQVADAMTWEFPAEQFDCVASIATLHHLPIEETLLKMREALKINGTLIILDLFQAEGLSDVLTSTLAVPAHIILRLIKTCHLREPREVREAWAEHGRSDSYPALSQIRQVCASVLPEARVRKHLLWRYSIVWKSKGVK
jgi:ubiquinone/menaquinone biosynthesis C-methylase UbiE